MFEFIMGMITGLVLGVILCSSSKKQNPEEPKKDPADWWKDT